MAATEVQICNLALSNLGVSTLLSSLSEDSNEARVCNVWYEQTRDAVLQDFPWNFCKRRVSLAEVSEDPATDWGYVYAYPIDCLAVRALTLAGMRKPRNDQRIEFEVAYNGSQRVIYTDQYQAELIYTAKVTDPSIFDPLFTIALSWALAAAIAPSLVGQIAGQSVAANMRETYVLMLQQAAAASMREGFEGVEPEVELLTVRY